MNKESRYNSGNKNWLARSIVLSVLIIIAAIAVFVNFKPQVTDDVQESEEEIGFSDVTSGVTKICELSTLRCYYHNVAEFKKEPDGLFKYMWFKYGFKKMWIEYTGIIEAGIDVDQVQVYEPDEDNIVEIYIPDARIINVSADSDSMSEPVSDTGAFTKITAEDQNQAFVQAQNDMKEAAENDSSILNRAKNNAKKLIEQYITKLGKYTVKWLDEPKAEMSNAEK